MIREQLTIEELKLAIDTIVQFSVPVGQAGPYVNLVNKMARMIDQARREAAAMPEQSGEQA